MPDGGGSVDLRMLRRIGKDSEDDLSRCLEVYRLLPYQVSHDTSVLRGLPRVLSG